MRPLRESPLFADGHRRNLVAVAPMRHVDRVVGEIGATHLVSVLNAHLMPATPAGIAPARHLKLAINDQPEADGGSRHPFSEQVEKLMEFAADWQKTPTPMPIHCFAGLSRSTAAAYILLCGLNPNTPETLVAHHLRQASDTATPNRIMVAIADHLLKRSGKMAAALDAIGTGSPAAEGNPFLLSIAFDARVSAAQEQISHQIHDIALD